MKLLWFILVLHTILASNDFGRAYMRKSKLCHQWICINNKLNLPDGLPAKEDFSRVLHDLLPPGTWQEVVEPVVETCYNNRSRRYTNTCPGQALMHCAFDQLNNNCPAEFTKYHDGCAPINSLAGFANMFTQSRYENMEIYLPKDTRPMWFLKNYFNRACCDIPQLFNSTVLSECGFTAMLAYYTHKPVLADRQFHSGPTVRTQMYGVPNYEGRTEHPVSNDDHTDVYGLKIEDLDTEPSYENLDPLDCCDVSDFMEPIWRQQCDFKLKWTGRNRLVVEEAMATTTTEATTTSESPIIHRDIMLLPQSCEKEMCVFNKLGILNDSNTVNVALFIKLLDNFTATNPSWERAKGRAITTCLYKPIDYNGECEINRVLSCIFDVLTENCPNVIKKDPCKRANDGRLCLISSLKYRPRHRRGTCNLPKFVNETILKECGLTSLGRIEQINHYNTTKKYKLIKIGCKDITPPTSCVLTKMGVLNKYGFMDYFKMNDRLKSLPHSVDNNQLAATYDAAFKNAPLYKEHCNSPRKLLNLLETMLFVCPLSKRKQTAQCSKLFEDMSLTPNLNQIPHKYIRQNAKHYQHIFSHPQHHTHNQIHKKYSSKIVKKPLYNYGLLNSKYAPKVETIDLPPKVEKKPLVLLPVYMRIPNTSLVLRPHDSTLRSGFWLQNLAQTHGPTTSPISTIPPVSTSPVSTASPISPTPVSYLRIPHSNLLIRSNNNNLLHRPFWKKGGVTQSFKYSTIHANEPVSTTPTYEPISTTPTYEPISTTSTNEPVSTTPTYEPISTTSTNEPISTTPTN